MRHTKVPFLETDHINNLYQEVTIKPYRLSIKIIGVSYIRDQIISDLHENMVEGSEFNPNLGHDVFMVDEEVLYNINNPSKEKRDRMKILRGKVDELIKSNKIEWR